MAKRISYAGKSHDKRRFSGIVLNEMPISLCSYEIIDTVQVEQIKKTTQNTSIYNYYSVYLLYRLRF